MLLAAKCQARLFQFEKPIYADYFLEAVYDLAQGYPNFFVREPLHNSSRTGHFAQWDCFGLCYILQNQ